MELTMEYNQSTPIIQPKPTQRKKVSVFFLYIHSNPSQSWIFSLLLYKNAWTFSVHRPKRLRLQSRSSQKTLGTQRYSSIVYSPTPNPTCPTCPHLLCQLFPQHDTGRRPRQSSRAAAPVLRPRLLWFLFRMTEQQRNQASAKNVRRDKRKYIIIII